VSSVAPSASTAPREHRYKLTAKQRSFAEALAADPTLNATRAAIAAGAGRGAAVTACKWLRLAKVQAYLTSLREQAEARAAARSARTVVTLTEILESLTAIAPTNLGAYIRIGPSGGG
jgi:phage terminase small subunit